MTKRTSSLDSSWEVGLHKQISLDSKVDGISRFSRQRCYVTHGKVLRGHLENTWHVDMPCG